MTGRVHALLRYPVKGLSAEHLEMVSLSVDHALPHDRRFAIAHGATLQSVAGPQPWMPKANFLQLMSDARLATLETRFDPENGFLSVFRQGRQVSRGQITDTTGRAIIEQFFSVFMAGRVRGRPRLVECDAQAFSDSRKPFVSLINLASVRDLERVVGRPVDPMRFRANILFDGAGAWEEFSWIGKSIRIGEASLRVEARIGRCAATNVDPVRGARDMTLPRSMQTAYGHDDCGIYATVTQSGAAAIGASLTIPEQAD